MADESSRPSSLETGHAGGGKTPTITRTEGVPGGNYPEPVVTRTVSQAGVEPVEGHSDPVAAYDKHAKREPAARRIATLAQRERAADQRQAELDAREEEVASLHPEGAQQVAQARQARDLQGFVTRVVEYVKANEQQFPTINALSVQHEVAELQYAVFQRDRRVLNAGDAARLLEEFYSEQAERAYQARARVKSFSSPTGPTRTLSPSRRSEPDSRPHDARDRYRRALELLRTRED